MPTTLTATTTYSATSEGPSAGEVATSAAMRGFLQTILNNTGHLYSIIGTGGTGIRKILSYAGGAAIRAAVGIANGEIVFDSTNNKIYRRDTGSSGSTNNEWYLDHDTEAGGYKLIRSKNAIIDHNAVLAVASASTTSSTYADVPGASIGVNDALNGDVLHVWCMVKMTAHASSGANFRLRFIDGAAVSNVLGPTSMQVTAGDGLEAKMVCYRYPITADGGGTLYAQHASQDNTNSISTEVMSLQFLLIRA